MKILTDLAQKLFSNWSPSKKQESNTSTPNKSKAISKKKTQ
jgi:hypothetical protein